MPDAVLLDVNVLVALSWPQHVHHHRARAWLRGHDATWATTPLTESAFLRLSLNESVTGMRLLPADVLAMLAAIRRQPGHRFVADASSLAAPSIDLARLSTSSQIPDLHLVNLAAENGMRLATLDRRIPQGLSPTERARVLVLPDA